MECWPLGVSNVALKKRLGLSFWFTWLIYAKSCPAYHRAAIVHRNGSFSLLASDAKEAFLLYGA